MGSPQISPFSSLFMSIKCYKQMASVSQIGHFLSRRSRTETCSSPVSSVLGHPERQNNNAQLKASLTVTSVQTPWRWAWSVLTPGKDFLFHKNETRLKLQSFLVVSAYSMGSLLLTIFLDRWLCTHTCSLCDQQHYCSCGYGSNMIKYGPIGPNQLIQLAYFRVFSLPFWGVKYGKVKCWSHPQVSPV